MNDSARVMEQEALDTQTCGYILPAVIDVNLLHIRQVLNGLELLPQKYICKKRPLLEFIIDFNSGSIM